MGRKPKPTTDATVKEAKAKRPPKAPKAKAAGKGGDGRQLSAADNASADAIRANFLQHRRSWKAIHVEMGKAEEKLKNLKGALKNDGFKVVQFKIADAMENSPKSHAKVVAEVTDRLQVARWIGDPMGAQLDLFAEPDRTPSVETAADKGKQDCMEGKTADPPYHQSSPQYQEYMTAYHDETERRTMAGLKPTEPTGDFDDEGEGNPVAEVERDPARPLN